MCFTLKTKHDVNPKLDMTCIFIKHKIKSGSIVVSDVFYVESCGSISIRFLVNADNFIQKFGTHIPMNESNNNIIDKAFSFIAPEVDLWLGKIKVIQSLTLLKDKKVFEFSNQL